MTNIVKNLWTFGSEVITNMWRPPGQQKDGTYWYPLNVGTFNSIECLKSFMEIPELSAVIIRKATAHSNGKFKVVNASGVEKKNDQVNKLFQKPNWFQSQKEFMMQTCLFHEIFGNEYLFMFTGMKTPRIDNVTALYTLPPNLVEAKYTDTLPFFLFGANESPKREYTIDVNGRRMQLDIEKIIHLNENRVNLQSTTNKDLLMGTSNIELLRAPLNNIRMSYESRGVILKYRGALGLITPDNKDALGKAITLEEHEIKDIQDKYRTSYGGLARQFQIMVSNMPLKWQQMGVNPDRLGLYKETEEDFRKIKDAWQSPDELYCSEKGSTFENQKQAWKRWYENSIIPDANERTGALNEVFMEDSNFKIVVDYSHLPIFQEDIKHRAEAMSEYINALGYAFADKQLTSDEYRAEMKKVFELGTGKAIPVDVPSPDNQEVETRTAQASLRGSVGGVQGILAIQSSVALGTTTYDSALNMLVIVFGFAESDARLLLGNPVVTEPQPTTTEQQLMLRKYFPEIQTKIILNHVKEIRKQK